MKFINSHSKKTQKKTSETESISYLIDKYPAYLMGHRGARGEIFENSVHGFEHLKKLSQISNNRLIGIELDVQLTRDGKLAVFHDDNLIRLYQSQSQLDQINFSQLKYLSQRCHSGQYCITLLEDIAPLLTQYQRIELEIKTHNRTNIGKLISALKETLNQPSLKYLPITLTSFDLNLHERMKHDSYIKKFKRGLLVEPTNESLKHLKTNQSDKDNELISTTTDISNQNLLTSTRQPLINTPDIAARLGCISIGLYHPFYNQSVINQCHRYGLSTTAWTVNEPEDVKKLIKLGVNYIITDFPTLMLNN